VAKAAELGHDPVQIYNWVRNNIEFVPTWGSIQGAQMTMETRQGNAMDTASLLISLLRASNIHARYVMGTVQLPIEQIMNWVGNFTDANAALDFMSSGGVPTTALTDAGKVVKARFEHVWVEAWIDYLPSRGAKHKDGEGDTWIPLDASFKQYAYTDGIDIAAAVPFDGQTFVDQLTATATINEAEGSVTGVDSLLVQQTMTDYQGRVEAYIAQQYPDATVGDVLGKKDVVAQDYPYLLGTLPYRTEVRGDAYAMLPSSLRHKLSFTVVRDQSDTAPLTYTASLPELAGKKITLSYTPATQADEDVISSYLPVPHPDGTPIQPEELPSALPAYLIKVKPELRIDGEIVAAGSPVTLGGVETFTMNFFDPATGSSPVVNTIDAGSYHAIGLDLGRIAELQVTALKSKLGKTKALLESQDFAGLTKDDLVGDLLYTTAVIYHAELGALKHIAARIMKVGALTLPSETIFATKLKIDSLWGLPRSVSAGGLNMDADRLMSVVKPFDGNVKTAINYMVRTGMASSGLEHSVPEKLFSTQEEQVEGVSAVKALQIANAQGMPIYVINQANAATIMPRLQVDAEAKVSIQDAVNTGKTVTVSQANISFNGWIGCGYIIADPNTGAGAYMITGGLSGAVINALIGLGGIMVALMLVAAGGPVGIALGLALFYVSFALFFNAMNQLDLSARATIIGLGLLLISGIMSLFIIEIALLGFAFFFIVGVILTLLSLLQLVFPSTAYEFRRWLNINDTVYC
jgi:hypothetical protein